MSEPYPDLIELRDLDVAVRYSNKRVWPLQDNLGAFICGYQRDRYAWAIRQRPMRERWVIAKAVHVLVYFQNPQQFFEFTYPQACWTDPGDALHGGYRLFRWRHLELDSHPAMDLARKWMGTKYDIGELIDFRVLPTFGLPQVRIIGSAERMVCSTGAAMLLHAAGAWFREELLTIPPAYWPVYAQDWEML